MSTTFEHTSVPASGFAARLEQMLDGVTARVGGHFRRRAAYNQIHRELSQLSDRNLSDLGISRHDIHTIVLDGSHEA